MADAFDLNTFISSLASGEPTPGGGSAAALAGALGAALAAMVGRLTAGRPKYATVDEQMQSAIVEADALRSRLLALVDEDAAAYDQVRAAYRLPKETVEQQTTRAAAIQQALQGASRTPLATVEACLAVLRLAEQVVRSGNPNAATDGTVGALLAHAGLRGRSAQRANQPGQHRRHHVCRLIANAAVEDGLRRGESRFDRADYGLVGPGRLVSLVDW